MRLTDEPSSSEGHRNGAERSEGGARAAAAGVRKGKLSHHVSPSFSRAGAFSRERSGVRQVQQERDELLKKQTEAILDVQQKSGLKEMLLERKLAALTETLEKREAQLCAALSVSTVDQTAASSAGNKLEVRF